MSPFVHVATISIAFVSVSGALFAYLDHAARARASVRSSAGLFPEEWLMLVVVADLAVLSVLGAARALLGAA